MQFQIDTERETVTVDGVEISLELLRHLANPDRMKFYHMTRVGNVVHVEAFQLESPHDIQ